jgi:hypothetical protein
MRLFLFLLLATGCAFAAQRESGHITQEELFHRTQRLADSVAVGDQSLWKLYYADDAFYFDEKGRAMDKTALVADVAPLPKGYSGKIQVVKPQSRLLGSAAVFAYDLDETEVIYGQQLHARYHGTDTWMYRNGRWQIVATQMMRYYEDAAVGNMNPGLFSDYIGTYELAPGVTQTILRDGDKLYSQRGQRPRDLLLPEVADLFFRAGSEGRRLFRRNASGKVDAMIDRRNNEDVIWKKL